jgi:hypothetical protein
LTVSVIGMLQELFRVHVIICCVLRRLPAMRPAVQPVFRAPRMGARGSMALVALRSLQTVRALF